MDRPRAKRACSVIRRLEEVEIEFIEDSKKSGRVTIGLAPQSLQS